MTLDGFCDHTAGVVDEEIHNHYKDLMLEAGVVLYGRTTYELMRFWQTLIEKPSGEQAMDAFALAIDQVPKIVFSHTLKASDLGWETATLSNRSPEEEVLALREQPGKDIYIGSRSLIIQLMKLNLIDEYQICIQPVVGDGKLPLFENMRTRTLLTLTKTKTFSGGAVIHYYEVKKESVSKKE